MAAGDRLYYSSAALLPTDRVHAGPMVLYSITGQNPDADAYLLIFDTGVAPPLTDGAIPLQSLPIPNGAEFSWSPANSGRPFLLGFVFATSSTPEVLTTSPVAVWVDVEGREL
jgi:hypothetical protein